jgi:cytochrome P450
MIPATVAHATYPHLLTSDGALHDRLRAPFRQPFLPKSIEALHGQISQIVVDLLEQARQSESIDLVANYALPLPLNIFASLFGATPDYGPRFRMWSEAMLEFFGKPIAVPEEAIAVEPYVADFQQCLRQLIAHARETGADNFAYVLGDPDWDAEMDQARIGTAILLVIAGHETTTNLIANTFMSLLLHPAQMAVVRADSKMVEHAVEETLRWEAPLQRLVRVVTRDTELSGITLRTGDRVALLLGSANRDPDLCERPEEFDLTRPTTAHLAFGAGVHFCLGASLARAEARTAVAAFLEQFPHATLEVGWRPAWRPKPTQRSLVDLNVRLGAPAGRRLTVPSGNPN